MATLNKLFNEKSITFGKILVLDSDSTLSIKKIKSLTGAKTVRQIYFNDDTEERFKLLNRTIGLGLEFYLKKSIESPKYYQIKGDVTSTFLQLQTNSIVALLNIEAKDFMQLHNSVNRCISIYGIRESVDGTLHTFREFKSTVPADNLYEYAEFNKQLIKSKKYFGEKLLKKSLSVINAFYKAKW